MTPDTRSLTLPGVELAPLPLVSRCAWLTPAELEAVVFELDQLEQLEARARARRARRKPEQLQLFS